MASTHPPATDGSQPTNILIDLTTDSDTEDTGHHFLPSHRRIRKSTNFYTPSNHDCVTTPNKKRKSKWSSEKSPTYSHQYVGARIAKYFGTELYLGTVAFVDDYYHIVYDDGDEEDMTQDELIEVMKLYKNHSSGLEQSTQQIQKTVHQSSVSKQFKPVVNSSSSSSPQTPSHPSPKRPSLFEIHNISPSKVEAVRQSLPQNLQSSAELISEFFLLCYERQLIWHRKRAGLKHPLTKDVKLSKSFYCNVYRELDRGTQYFRSNLIRCRSRVGGGSSRYDLEEVLWDSLCYRLVNKIETFVRFTKIPNREEWEVSCFF